MPQLSPETWAQIRAAYEHTETPVEDICLEHGISSTTLRNRMRRWRWTRRRPPIPREGPPPVLPAVIPGRGPRAANPESITPPAAYGFQARRQSASETRVDALMAASRNDGDSDDHPTPPPSAEDDEAPADAATIVPRLRGAVARLLPAIEATIARLAAGAHHPREMEQAGRALSSLTRTLRELNALLAQHLAHAGSTPGDEIPQDMDAFRAELARRLNAIIDAMAEDDEEAKAQET